MTLIAAVKMIASLSSPNVKEQVPMMLGTLIFGALVHYVYVRENRDNKVFMDVVAEFSNKSNNPDFLPDINTSNTQINNQVQIENEEVVVEKSHQLSGLNNNTSVKFLNTINSRSNRSRRSSVEFLASHILNQSVKLMSMKSASRVKPDGLTDVENQPLQSVNNPIDAELSTKLIQQAHRSKFGPVLADKIVVVIGQDLIWYTVVAISEVAVSGYYQDSTGSVWCPALSTGINAVQSIFDALF